MISSRLDHVHCGRLISKIGASNLHYLPSYSNVDIICSSVCWTLQRCRIHSHLTSASPLPPLFLFPFCPLPRVSPPGGGGWLGTLRITTIYHLGHYPLHQFNTTLRSLSRSALPAIRWTLIHTNQGRLCDTDNRGDGILWICKKAAFQKQNVLLFEW